MKIWHKAMRSTSAIVVGWLILAGTAQAGTVTIGLPAEPHGGNCIPFGCISGVDHFQEIYSGSSFTGSIWISEIDFFDTNSVASGNFNSGTFVLSLSTTSKLVGGLDTNNLANNLGADNTLFATYTLSGGPAGSVLSFFGTSFDYNPASGNLLLDIQMSGLSHVGNDAFLDVPSTSTGSLSRAYSGSMFGQDSDGLVTRFVPGPATLALVAVGLAGLGFSRRKQ